MSEEGFEKDNFKEKAYEILYHKYQKILNGLIQDSFNLEYRCKNSGDLLGEDRPEYIKRKVEAFESLSKLNEWSKKGIATKEDIAVVKALEHCLGEKYGFTKDIK